MSFLAALSEIASTPKGINQEIWKISEERKINQSLRILQRERIDPVVRGEEGSFDT